MQSRHTQTITEPPNGNALQACVATVLSKPLDEVPNFVAEASKAATNDYWQIMTRHAASLGLGLLKLPLTPAGALPFASTPGSLCLARGTSPRGNGHVIVCAVAADGSALEPIHDPFPDGGGLVGPAVWAAFYIAAEPSALASTVPSAAITPPPVLATEPAVRALSARLAPALRACGFDLLAPFQAGAYNSEPHIAKLGPEHKIDAPASALCFIIGNSRALWRPFTRWVAERLASDDGWLEARPHALDEYTRHVLEGALGACGVGREQVSVLYAYETVEEHGRAISVTTAAHVAGLAYYEPTHQRSVHPTLGPWIAYRAILAFDVGAVPLPQPPAGEALLPHPPPPTDPCTAAEWARVGELQSACFALWEGEAGSAADWERLVEIVQSFDTGRAHAYPPDMVGFHYEPLPQRRVAHLRRCALEVSGEL